MLTVARSPWASVTGPAPSAAASGWGPPAGRAPGPPRRRAPSGRRSPSLGRPARPARCPGRPARRSGPGRRGRAPGRSGTSSGGGSPRNARCIAATRSSTQSVSSRRERGPPGQDRVAEVAHHDDGGVALHPAVDHARDRRRAAAGPARPSATAGTRGATVPPVRARVRSEAGVTRLTTRARPVGEPDVLEPGAGLALVSRRGRTRSHGVVQQLGRRHALHGGTGAPAATMPRPGWSRRAAEQR